MWLGYALLEHRNRPTDIPRTATLLEFDETGPIESSSLLVNVLLCDTQ